MLPKRYWFAWLKRRTLGAGKVRGTIDAATGTVHFYGKGKVRHATVFSVGQLRRQDR